MLNKAVDHVLTVSRILQPIIIPSMKLYNRNYSSYYSSMFWAYNHSGLKIMRALETLVSIIFIIIMFDLLWVPHFIKIGTNFSIVTKFARVYNLESRPSIPSTIFIISMFDLLLMPNVIKIGAHFTCGTTFRKFQIFGQGHQFQLIYP